MNKEKAPFCKNSVERKGRLKEILQSMLHQNIFKDFPLVLRKPLDILMYYIILIQIQPLSIYKIYRENQINISITLDQNI